MPYKDVNKKLEAQRSHYAKNSDAIKSRVRIQKKQNRQRWQDFKSTLSCLNCGIKHPALLDFHHVTKSPDNRNVYLLASNGAFKKVFEEIKKCVVLCANCHRLHHYEEREVKKAKRKKKKKAM